MILAVQFPKPYQANEFKDVFVAEMRYWLGALWIWNVARNFVCVGGSVGGITNFIIRSKSHYDAKEM